MKHIQYICIDEMSFIGPKLVVQIFYSLAFMQIEIWLRVFQKKTNYSFDNWSIIIVSDLGQVLLVMDKPIYARETIETCLWTNFTTLIILQTVFRKKGNHVAQVHF